MTARVTARINRALAHFSEPAYEPRPSQPRERKLCRERLPLAECNFFHDCLSGK